MSQETIHINNYSPTYQLLSIAAIFTDVDPGRLAYKINVPLRAETGMPEIKTISIKLRKNSRGKSTG